MIIAQKFELFNTIKIKTGWSHNEKAKNGKGCNAHFRMQAIKVDKSHIETYNENELHKELPTDKHQFTSKKAVCGRTRLFYWISR